MTANANQPDAPRPRISMVVDAQQRWEYRQEANCTPTQLNQYGYEGWRLVGPPTFAKISLGTSGRLLYVFERPLRTPPQ